jgi:putative copper resistance protein D
VHRCSNRGDFRRRLARRFDQYGEGFGSVVDLEDLRLFFFETPFGTVSFLRLALLAISVVLAFLPWHDRWRFAALVPVGALLLITQAWFGHSAEGVGLYRASMIAV